MFVGGWGSTAPDHIYLFFLGKKKKKNCLLYGKLNIMGLEWYGIVGYVAFQYKREHSGCRFWAASHDD
jgi:hypothetical protein